MNCPDCNTPMEKEHINTLDEGKLTYFTNWYCKNCGKREYRQYDVKF